MMDVRDNYRVRAGSRTDIFRDIHKVNDKVCNSRQKKRRRKHKWTFLYNKKSVVTSRSALSFSLQLSKAVSEETAAESEDNHNSLYIETDSDEIPKVLDAMEEEIERQLEEKAEKTNLTVANVKNMLKAVITNRDVMHMVNYSLQRSSEKPDFAPKLTRAKTKELMEKEAISVCQVPLITKKSEFVELIAQDLLEDSSDEEYKPHEDWSDEESKTSENISLGNVIIKDTSESVKENNVCGMTSAENIGQRTRSKLCLSETPLEAIEQAFIPPDITTDMYNTECDNQDWANFLKEFMQPLDNNLNETIDDENDPEYNVMADEEHESPDIEELRVDRAVKVSKKELNDLMSELCEFTNMSSDEEVCEKKEMESPTKVSPETSILNRPPCGEIIVTDEWKTKKTTDYSLIISEINVNKSECITEKQYLLISQQLSQHVQLITQHFLLIYGNPYLSDLYGNVLKQLLVQVQCLGNKPTKSIFNVVNLTHSLDLVRDWEKLVNTPDVGNDIKRFILQEENFVKLNKDNKKVYYPKLPKEMVKLCMQSKAFLYPLMLPTNGFRSENIRSSFFFHSENMLIAIGLDEFTSYLENDVSTSNNWTLYELASHITEYLMPTRSVMNLVHHIKKMKTNKLHNPIQYYYKEKKAPEINHFIISISNSNLKKLCDQPPELLPSVWVEFNEV